MTTMKTDGLSGSTIQKEVALLKHMFNMARIEWAWRGFENPTHADLRGFGPDDVPTLVGVLRSVCGIAVDDGIVFDLESTAGTPIRKNAGYGGVRIDLSATLDGARLSLQIDIGFGDAVTPAPQSIAYPTLLPDAPHRRCAPTPGPRSSPRNCMP